MDSFFARNRLSAYLDRTLPKVEAEAVAEAIARDIALSADVQAMHKVLAMMHEVGAVEAPTGFHARTMATIAAQPVPGSQVAWLQRRLTRIPTELVALIGAAVIAAIALQRGMPIEPDGPVVDPAYTVQATPPPTTPTPEARETPDAPESVEGLTRPPTAPTRAAAKAAKQRRRTVKTPVPESLPYDPADPLAYRILSGGDQVLYDIATLADESGGRLVDVHGKLVTPRALDEGNSYTAVYMVVNEANAAATHARLLERSGMEPYPLDGPQPPLKEGETVFMIEAQL